MIKNIFLYSVVTFFIFNIGYSQTTTERKLSLAQSYEQVGQLDNAIRIYEEVYSQDKGYLQAFHGLIRSYKLKNMNAKLLELLEDRVQFDKKAVNYILLGEARWNAGKSSEADEAWENALKTEPKNQYTYADLAEVQSRLQLYNKAINTYLKARKNISTNNGLTLFTEELSKLYIAIGNTKGAINESLTLLMEMGALPAVEARIYALMQDEDNLDIVDETLNEFIDKNSSNYMANELFSWYKTNLGNHSEALEYTIKADEISNQEGRLIITFGGNAEQSGNTDIALEAYQYIIDQGKSNKFFTSAIYSYTRTLEAKMMFDKNLSIENIQQIIKRYRTIIEEFPKSSTAADAYLEIARLQKDRLRDYKKSKETLFELTKEIPGAPQSGTALVELSEIFISRGDLVEAKGFLETAKVRYGRNNREILEIVGYKQALIEYYTGNLDSAEALFLVLSEAKDNDIANDVLEKNSIISDKYKEEEKVKTFAAAEYDLIRLDTSSAIAKYESIINELRNFDTEIWQRSHLILSDIYMNRRDLAKADYYLEEFIRNLPDGVHTDKALFKLASNKVLAGDNSKAIELYSKILINFPNSIYLDQARSKIRELRGES
jgi:tetratricopeptide (TPR) repeat protein